ncbi:MAG: heavy-metal-associated domain-containing protein [Proteobacteria bacterium]|nr:heavy-metal-associated domain-containing protein [Pseudomonadota bacterium]
MNRSYSAPTIHCHSCAGLIKETLEDTPAVRSVAVDVAAKTVTIEYVSADGEPEVLRLLEAEGYPVTPC